MKKSFVVIGLGRFGLTLLEELSNYGNEIIGIDNDLDAVNKASNIIEQVYQADSTSEIALKNIGVQNIDHAIIAFSDNLEDIIMSYVTLKDLGIKNITVRCDQDKFVPILNKLGINDIISPTKLAAKNLASKLVSPNFIDYFQLEKDYCIVELPLLDNFKTIKLIDLNARNQFDVNILMIKRDNKIVTPKGNDELKANDILFVFGKDNSINKLSTYLRKS